MGWIKCGRGAWLSLTLLVCTSCGSDREIVPVRGKVLYQGEPLTSGSVMFQPLYGQPARGAIQPDGTFELSTDAVGDGAVVGMNQVRIAAYEPAGEAIGGEQQVGRLLIPKRYTSFATSGLQVEVKSANNEPFVFDLTD